MAKDMKNEYRRPEVYSGYDAKRFASFMGRRRNRKKIAAIGKALSAIGKPGLVLDMPCGTGRLFGFLREEEIDFVGADVSEGMLGVAAAALDEPPEGRLVAADAENLPFRDGAFDAVICIRFLFHLDAELRVRMLREMARVAKAHLVVDYRVGFSIKNWLRNAFSPITHKYKIVRPSREEMFAELAGAGVTPVAVFAVQPFFSDKHVILCRKSVSR